MRMSTKGIAFLTAREGCKLTSYKDSVGVWTIGVGITTAAGLGKIGPGMTITQAQSDAMLAKALTKYEDAVNAALTRAPNQNQFDAMVSLCFNIGPGGFAGSSVVRKFNANDTIGAADAFLAWTKAGGKVLKGLTTRRGLERALFLTPMQTPEKPVEPVSPPPEPKPAPEAEKPPAPVSEHPVGFWKWLWIKFFS